MRVLVVAVAVLAAAAARADDPVAYRVEVDPRSVFAAVREDGARQVSLQFRIVRPTDGAVVVSVPPEEVRIDEDGRPVAALRVLQPRSERLSVVLAMDISGSMARANKMEAARQAALTFLDRLDAAAEVGLILFDHQVRVAVPPERDPSRQKAHREALRRQVRDAKPQGGTAYLDAAVQAIGLLKGSRGRRAVVVMTDGVDMNSKADLKTALAAATAAEVPVYTVGIGAPGKNDPVTTVLVLDRSGSMTGRADSDDPGTKMVALKQAARRFVELMRPAARTTLLPFSTEVERPEPFTADQAALKERIDALEPAGGTLFYDATLAGVETLLAGGGKGRRAVVALTDGRDEAPGSRHSDDDVIERAREAGVPLYLLGLGAKDEINEPVMQRMARETGGEYYHAGSQGKLLELFEALSIQLHDDGIDETALAALAKKTGGKYTHVSQVAGLREFYERLADELQSTYRATFESRRPSHDGTARGIDVKVVRRGQVVSTVGSVDDVARGVIVPQMSHGVYLLFLAVLGGLLLVPSAIRRLYRAYGGT